MLSLPYRIKQWAAGTRCDETNQFSGELGVVSGQMFVLSSQSQSQSESRAEEVGARPISAVESLLIFTSLY